MTGSCPACGSVDESTIEAKGNAWRICGNCQTWTLKSAVSAEVYPSDYYGTESAKFGGPAGALRTHFHSGRSKRLRRMCSESGAKLYDIGCGDGTFLESARQCGFAIRGCEPEQFPRQQAAKRLGCSIDEEIFEAETSNQWDVVSAWQVIEHVPDPRGFVRAIKKGLKPGGVLAVSTVNIDSVQARLFGANWQHLDPPRHLWCGSLGSVERLLSEEGFVVESRRWNWPEFGPVGFVDSAMNAMGFERDTLVHKLKVGFGGAFDPVFWTAAVLTPPAIMLAAAEAMWGKPATFELYLRNA